MMHADPVDDGKSSLAQMDSIIDDALKLNIEVSGPDANPGNDDKVFVADIGMHMHIDQPAMLRRNPSEIRRENEENEKML